MVSLTAALRGVKRCIGQVLSRTAIELACERHGHSFRSGPLDPPNTVQLFVRQVVEGNVAGTAVVRLAGGRFTDPAWCQARQRLPLAVLRDLSEQVRDRLRQSYPASDKFRWHGHRVALIDGSNFSMPDTPDVRKYFGEVPGQKPGCGFPIAHWLAVFDFHSGVLLYDEVSAYCTPDLKHTPEAHQALEPGTVLLGDDSFAGYVHLALALQRGLHGIFPAHHARIVEFKTRRKASPPAESAPTSRRVRTLGHNDQIVELSKPKTRPKWLSKEVFDSLPATIEVREIRRTVRRKGFRPRQVTVVTTLLDPKEYPAGEVVAMRERRWDVETDIRHLKTTMGMEVLRCKTAQGVLKELAVFGIVYNLVRGVMLESARRQQASPTRLSFADGLAWLCHADDGHEWPTLKIVPLRPGRIEPRAVKRRPKPFGLMNRPRAEMRQRAREKLGGRIT